MWDIKRGRQNIAAEGELWVGRPDLGEGHSASHGDDQC